MKSLLPIIASFLLSMLFLNLFYGEYLGLNLVLFLLVLGGAMLVRHHPVVWRRELVLTSLGTLVSMAAMLVQGTGLAAWATVLSFYAWAGLLLAPELVSLVSAWRQTAKSLFHSPRILAMGLAGNQKSSLVFKVFRIFSVATIPLFIGFVFWLLYVNSHPEFSEFSRSVERWVSRLELSLDWEMTILWGMGFAISLAMLDRYLVGRLSDQEGCAQEQLSRRLVKSRLLRDRYFKTLSLKKEAWMLMGTLGILNLILLILNLMDIRQLWFGFSVPVNFDLKTFVHEGTYVLIFSILLAMAILLYFFRGNLNFYPRSRWMRGLALAWIVQNAVLTLSVGLRVFHYMDYHGLAYKRIAVVFVLLLILVGLVLMAIKVRRQKSTFYVVRRQAWAFYLVLVITATVHWDLFIARHNLSRVGQADLDLSFLVELSDATLPLLYENRDVLAQAEGWYSARGMVSQGELVHVLHNRIMQLRARARTTTWRSWTLAEANSIAYFVH